MTIQQSITTMKAQRKNAVSKLMIRFDNELKNILMNDLAAVKNSRLASNIQQQLNSRLSAA